MRSDPVVAVHEVMADISLRFSDTQVTRRRYPLGLQTAKEPFHRRVIPAVTPPAHALPHPVTPEPLSEQAARVLAALVGMKHHLLRPAALLIGHLKRTG